MGTSHYILFISLSVLSVQSAKILAWFPTPSISHQVVFRPVTQELAKRGHEVVVITTDPAFPPGQAPSNLTEIDLHDMCYGLWRELVMSSRFGGHTTDPVSMMGELMSLHGKIMELQVFSEPVQKILKEEADSFDLLIVETCGLYLLTLADRLKVPLICISSLGAVSEVYDFMGAPTRPALLYPNFFRQKLNNLTLTDKLSELYNQYRISFMMIIQSVQFEIPLVKRAFGSDVRIDYTKILDNVDLLFLNINPLWDFNRPVPPKIVYLGGVHQKPAKELEKEWQSYLDSSKNGVIYVSFGTNVSPSHLPPERIQLLVKVFSQLPYDILWKWDKDELPGRTANIRIAKWLPQSDLLRHPKVKAFITQCGLQSTDEAITAGVPLIGMPMLGDQWYNAEMYEKFKIGIRADLSELTEEKLKEVIDKIVNDESYRKNIEKLRNIMQDQPQTPLERAVWWTEYVIRHGGAKHLRAPAANMTWAEYLDLELLAAIAGIVFTAISLVVLAIYLVVRFIRNTLFPANKLKKS